LLANIGSRKEVDQYLRHYASVDAPKFAVVKVSGSVIERSADDLVSSLSFLQRVGLVPIVVHGSGAQVDRALADSGVASHRAGGRRVMTPEVLAIARRTLHETNRQVVESLEALGTRTRPFTSGVFEVEAADDPELGLTGNVTHVADAGLISSARAGALAVVAPLAETKAGQIVVLEADQAARELALALRPHKVVFLNERGGLEDGGGTLLSAVNLCEDWEALAADPSLPEETTRKLRAIASMLDALPATSSVSITSPAHLAKELFTHRGAGTLVRRGERVHVHSEFGSLDRDRLRALLEECFGRQLHARYFESKQPYRVYLSESYRATAILTLEDGIPYLDKFAVTTEAQGEGIGGSLWNRLRKENPQLFWRSRAENPINAWYAQNADGLYTAGRWWVFWCGLSDFDAIRRCVERALAMPATLNDNRQEASLEGAS
jgi:acetylglutamate kinase